jgi:DNA (cytosine-5)-methyltransferase 1
MNDLTHLSLFTGIGGIDLAAEWAGFRTIGQVEQNPYALRVLRNRFGRRIPRWTDIRDISADNFKRRTGIDSPTIITGGFPCQPFSCAGKRRGKEDDRYLWPEMLRVVRELRPAWVLGENVAGIVNMELESCCADLEGEGYTVRAFLVPACGVGAWHRRERVFIVVHTSSDRCNYRRNDRRERSNRQEGEHLQEIKQERKRFRVKVVTGCRGVVPPLTNTNSQGLQERNRINFARGPYPPSNRCGWWDVEPALGRLAHGVPDRVDRLRCLGNAVVPQQVYPILAGIAQIELSEAEEVSENGYSRMDL